jgi:tellurite resistance protein TerC
MDKTQMIYLVFGVVLISALIFDLGLISKKETTINMKKALLQTLLWVSLSLAFWFFLWMEEGGKIAVKYISAYLMEWSLSIDNIFVFILIFNFFKVKEIEAGRVLLIGILLAIVFRILFIAAGIELISRKEWILYLFGVFLLYTGIKLFFQKEEQKFNPEGSKVIRFVNKIFRISHAEPNRRFIVKQHGKIYFTSLSLVVLTLAGTDIAFALDSIPTVVSLVRDNTQSAFTKAEVLVIYSSNIFAVLGLRSLFFLLRGAADRFVYLQQGIAVILVFIGAKMLVAFFDIHISIYVSLAVIVACIGASILFSIIKLKQKENKLKN